MFSGDGDGDATPAVESAGDFHPTGVKDADEVIEDSIDDGFVKSAVVSEREQIEFERLAFEAEGAGDVFDLKVAEIGLAGDGAEAGEFGAIEVDGVRAGRFGVGKGFEAGLFRAGRVLSGAFFQEG